MEGLSVALVGRFFDPHVAGAEVNARRLGQALVAAGVPCEVVTTRFAPDLPRLRVEGGVRVRRLSIVRGRLGRPVEFGQAFLYLLRHGGRFTVIQADCLSAFSLGAILGGRLRGARTIVGTCTAEPDGDISRILGRPGGDFVWRLFRLADMMSVHVPPVMADLRRFGVARRRIVRLPNVVPIGPAPGPDGSRATTAMTARNPLGLPDRPTVLYIGRLSEEKGVDILLEAWRVARARRSATLVLVGDGPLAGRATAMGSSDPEASIVVAGVRTLVEPWIDAADVFAFASRSETFGLALAEAMGRGLAVVSTPTGLVNDGFEDGVHGRVVPIGDAAALADALDELLSDEGGRAAMGAAAQAFVAARFAPAVALDAHLALYRRLTSEARV